MAQAAQAAAAAIVNATAMGGEFDVGQYEHLNKLQEIKKKPVSGGTELRIAVPQDAREDCVVKVYPQVPDTPATAEVFGQELVMGQEYRLPPGSQIAVFTWHGFHAEIKGNSRVYDGSNASIRDYINAAAILEQRRVRAEDLGLPAPVVLVTGGRSQGKSSFAQMLCNLAIRKGRTPTFVELDPRGASWTRQIPTLPGCISATSLDFTNYTFNEEPFPISKMANEGDVLQSATSLPGRSVSLYYGYREANAQPRVYQRLVAQLSCLVDAKLQHARAVAGGTALTASNATSAEKKIACSGVIVHG